MGGGAWWAAFHGVAKSRTQLRNFTFTFHFSLSCIGEGNGNPLQCFAWRIPGTVEPDGLLSMGSHRVGHDCSDLAAADTSATVPWLLLYNNVWQGGESILYSQVPPTLKGRGLYNMCGNRILEAILELCLQQPLLRTQAEPCESYDLGESKMLLTSRT